MSKGWIALFLSDKELEGRAESVNPNANVSQKSCHFCTQFPKMILLVKGVLLFFWQIFFFVVVISRHFLESHLVEFPQKNGIERSEA